VKGVWLRVIVGVLVVAFIAWIGSQLTFKEEKIPLPLHGEAARNPFYGAIRLSQELGAEAAWERVFTTPSSNSVILLSSWNWSLSGSRRERIEHWVEAGGRLVVDKSLVGDLDEFERWSGIGELKEKPEKEKRHDKKTADEKVDEDEVPEDGAAAESDEEPATDETAAESDEASAEDSSDQQGDDENEDFLSRLRGRYCGPLVEDGTQRNITVCGVDHSRSLTTSRKILWALRSGRKIEAIRTQVGRGSVTAVNADPFGYRDFLDGDHPTLFVRMAQLHRGDQIMFLTEQDHASLMRLMWRFGAPAVLLLFAAVALGLWRAGMRFGPPVAATESARRSLAEQIRGTGQFALRFGGGRSLHAATLRALRNAAIHRFPGYDEMASEARIEAVAKTTGIGAGELGPAMNFLGERSPHELREAIAVLESARRRLLTHKKDKHGN